MKQEIKGLIVVFLYITLISLTYCKNKRPKTVEVNFGIGNLSQTIKKVDIEVYLNQKKLLYGNFEHVPYDSVYQFKFPYGNYTMKIQALDNSITKEYPLVVSESDTLIGVSIRFDYYRPDSMDISAFKEFYKQYHHLDTIPANRKKMILLRIVNNGKLIKDW